MNKHTFNGRGPTERRWLGVLLLVTLALGLARAGPRPGGPIGRILDDLASSSSLDRNLEVLCDQIGGRIPGTPVMDRAVQWAKDAFHRAGLERVHTEEFRIPNSWLEGDSRAEVLTPAAFRAHVAALGWSAATPPGGVETEVLAAGEGEDGAIAELGEKARGKILLVQSDPVVTFQDMAVEQRRATIALQDAGKAGAAAVLLMSTRPRDLLYRHTNVVDGRIDPMPSAVVAREDGERIWRLLEAGHKVTMRLDLPNKIGGEFPADNVVAEIPGREKPDEAVILGAHLDSWDLGTGCLDNGCNAALVLEVARSIQASAVRYGGRPRRTIRFVLFGAEEEGLLGSHAYVQQHRAQLDKIMAVVVHDIGVGKISGYSLGGRKDLEPAVRSALEPVASSGANSHTTDAFFGTDHFDFMLEGIPTLVANQDTTDYVPNYHARSDTFDKVDITELKRQAEVAATLIYDLADAPGRPAPRQSRAEVETMMKETRLDDQLRFLGLWGEWKSGERGRQR